MQICYVEERVEASQDIQQWAVRWAERMCREFRQVGEQQFTVGIAQRLHQRFSSCNKAQR